MVKKLDLNLEKELISWRRELHKIPESAFEEFKTSDYLAKKLEEMGYEVERNVGKTGLVASLSNGNSEKSVALRADMDCINIPEKRESEYKSTHENKMHACGHDGHMATMLGAAKILSERKDFNGTVRFIFQPAEEPGYGAKAMIDEGLFDKFKIDEVYGFHNMPGLPEGTFHSKVGGIMASEDNFMVKIKGRGGHASAPNLCIDPLVIAANLILAFQTIVSRNADPIDTAVVSCTEILTDGAHNAIPSNVTILGDTRSFDPKVQELIEERMKTLTKNICESYGADWEFEYTHEFSPTINTQECYEAAITAAKNVLGEDKVVENCKPMMSSEDFAKYLELKPGCFSFIGGAKDKQEGVFPLHNHDYDYNDDNLIKGAEVFAELVRLRLN